MSAIEKLAQSAKNRHGRQLQPDEVQEVVAALQSTAIQLGQEQARNEALVRVGVAAVRLLGGQFKMTAEEYDEITPQFGLAMEWNEEEEIIYVETYEVGLQELRPEDGGDVGEIDGDLAPVPTEQDGTQMQLAIEEDGEG